MSKQSPGAFMEQLAAPARRALISKGITTVESLSFYSEKEILALHGLGKSSIPKLKAALAEKALSFRK